MDNCLAKESTPIMSPLSAARQIESKSCSSSVTQETKREASLPADSATTGVRVQLIIFAPPFLQEIDFALESIPQLGQGIGSLIFKFFITSFAGQI